MAHWRQRLIFIATVIFFISLSVINRAIRFKALSSSTLLQDNKTDKDRDSKENFIEENSQYHVKPSDPAQYNIKIQGQYDIPLTEQQWEYKMRQGLAGARGSERSSQQILQGIKKTPEEIEQQIADLDVQIKEFDAISLNNPADQKAREKLQTLYMLKATLMVVKDKLTGK